MGRGKDTREIVLEHGAIPLSTAKYFAIWYQSAGIIFISPEGNIFYSVSIRTLSVSF